MSLAIDRNQPDLVRALIPMVSRQFLENLYYEKFIKQLPSERVRYGVISRIKPFPMQISAKFYPNSVVGCLTIYNLFATELGTEVFTPQNTDQIYFDLEDRNWEAVDRKFSELFLSVQYQFILSMIYSQDDQAWLVAQKYIPDFDELNMELFLRAALECGNKNQVDWLLQYLPYIKTGKLYAKIFATGIYFGAYNRAENISYIAESTDYSFICDAYCGANLELIQQFESYGYKLRRFDPDTFISTGYRYGLSNPISVYNLAVQLSTSSTYLYDIPGNIDITSLSVQNPKTYIRFRQIINHLLPEAEGTIGVNYEPGVYYEFPFIGRGDIGNVDALNWLLSEYKDLPELSHVIEGKLENFPPWYPLTRKILESYLEISQ